MSDTSIIDPVDDVVKLSSGLEVRLLPLKARQFFKLLRIISHGAAGQLASLRWSGIGEEEFVGQILGLLAFSIPDSEEETIDFLKSITSPVGLTEHVVNKQDKARNDAKWTRHFTEMDNPELPDLMDLVEAIVRRESGDLVALGKRLGLLLEVARKTGQLEPTQESPSEPSPEPSTSSPPSMDGETTTSSTSLSSEYASS